MVTLKTLLVNAPEPLRERFIRITGKTTLIRAMAALRPGTPTSTIASAKRTLRALANRRLMLDTEIKDHEAVPETLVRAQAPALMEASGVSTGTIADMLVVLAENPQRIRSEAAFAKLCGVCPVPASSGKPIVIASTGAAIAGQTQPCIEWHSSACGMIRQLTNTSSVETEGNSPREIRRRLKR